MVFKRLNKADVTNVPYVANKQWNLSYTSAPNDDYITYYVGQKDEFNITGSTTTQGQYKSLVYDSINHLFYQSYTDLLDTGSLLFDTNTYESASQQRPTSSYFDYNNNPLLIKNYPTTNCREYSITYVSGPDDLYWEWLDCNGDYHMLGPVTSGTQSFCASKGDVNILQGNYILTDNGVCTKSGIGVLSVNQNIYGSKILPHSFAISTSLSTIKDDGNGNLNTGSTHVGNIFYSHGLAVITNSDYLSTFSCTLYSLSGTRGDLTVYQYVTCSGASVTESIADSTEYRNITGSINIASGPGSYNAIPFNISFQNEHIIYENEVRCIVKESEFNLSYNPTLVTGSYESGSLRSFSTGSTFHPYTTAIGLYNDDNELLMVAKLAKPIVMSADTDMTFIVKYDT